MLKYINIPYPSVNTYTNVYATIYHTVVRTVLMYDYEYNVMSPKG